jgi:tRNA pseudouridine55 synthase
LNKPVIQRRAISGVLLLDKPAGLSSTNALGRAKWLYQAEKGGHTGTLDPFATGLLPLCFGEATKFSRFMLDADKTYVATLKLGSRTATGDTESEPYEQRRVGVSQTQIDRVLAQFCGAQLQTPPMHSALKRNGVELYKLARQGIEIEREPRAINVSLLGSRGFDGGTLTIETCVSKGTYIRVLAEDIGEALGCGAHLVALRRIATAGFSVADAMTLDTLEGMALDQRDVHLRAAESLCEALPRITLSHADCLKFRNGQELAIAARSAGEVAVYGPVGGEAGQAVFLGVAQVAPVSGAAGAGNANRLVPVRLMAT